MPEKSSRLLKEDQREKIGKVLFPEKYEDWGT